MTFSKRRLALLAFWCFSAASPLCVVAFQPPSARRGASLTNQQPSRTTQGRFVATVSPKQQQPAIVGGSSSTVLQASPLLTAAGSPLGSFLVLAGIIIVHECGHYFAARGFGMSVEEFSIGFGPKVAGFEALGNEFNLRALPLGGYVRFPENYNATLVREQEKELFEARQAAAEANNDDNDNDNNIGFQILNAVTFGVLEERKRKQQQQEQEQEQLRLAEEEANKPWWKTVFANNNNNKPKAAAAAAAPLPTEVEIEYYDDPNLLQNRPWFERAVVLSGGVVFNLILAFLIYFGEILSSSGLPQPVFGPGAVISQEPLAGGASIGVLKKGDVITRVNGVDLTQSTSPNAMASQKAITEFISTIRNTPDGDKLHLSIVRQNMLKEVDIEPKRTVASNQAQSLGVILSPNFIETQRLKTGNPLEASRQAFDAVADLTKQTTVGIVGYLAQVVSGAAGSGGGPAGQVSGPIGLIKQGSDVVSTKDWTTILLFAAGISINLGVVNALPLPALDGGQLVFVLAEAVTGRKVDERFQESITGITLFLLLLASVSAAVGDVQSIAMGIR